jgi:hypothetical protein
MFQWEGSGIRCEKQIILLRNANICLHKLVFTVLINGYAGVRNRIFYNSGKKYVVTTLVTDRAMSNSKALRNQILLEELLCC